MVARNSCRRLGFSVQVLCLVEDAKMSCMRYPFRSMCCETQRPMLILHNSTGRRASPNPSPNPFSFHAPDSLEHARILIRLSNKFVVIQTYVCHNLRSNTLYHVELSEFKGPKDLLIAPRSLLDRPVLHFSHPFQHGFRRARTNTIRSSHSPDVKIHKGQ